MNNIGTNMVALLIVLIVVFSVGRLVLLANTQKMLDQANHQLNQMKSNQQLLETEFEKLRTQIQSEVIPSRSSKLLLPGHEASLLRNILDLGGKSMRLDSYHMLDSFRVKSGEEQTFSNTPSPAFGGGEELPQLDDQGMPVGLAMESDEEWPGVEVIPVKMTFTSTYSSFGRFLSEAGKNMPVSSVRSLDLLLKDAGIVKGTLVMNFPVAETR